MSYAKTLFDCPQICAAFVLEMAAGLSLTPGSCLFYSGGSLDSAERSILTLFPVEEIVIPSDADLLENPWDVISCKMKQSPGFWCGYLSYEMGAFSDRQKKIPYIPPTIPLALLVKPAVLITFDYVKKQVALKVNKTAVATLPLSSQLLIEEMLQASFWKQIPFRSSTKRKVRLAEVLPPEEFTVYRDKIAVIKELILSGDIYQANLSQRVVFKGEAEPFRLFEHIARINPAPFMAFLNLPDFSIVSSSPERLLSKRGNVLETRPIKGTAPRGAVPDEDAANRLSLLQSAKDRAELLMITDLMRNDLARVSVPGSVQTLKLWHCEAYANVFHLLSQIQAKARNDLDSIEIVRACFPGGSISGCPKLRAMEVIHAVEARSRGIYTGSIGYIDEEGDFDFNIAIRTLLIQGDLIEMQLGGGIVADSDPVKEYEETLHKGQSLFQVLSGSCP